MIGASFENGASGFRPYNLASSVTQEVVSDGTAYSGNSFLRARTKQDWGSVALDFDASQILLPGSRIGVIAWVRSAPGQGPFSLTLAIWQIDEGKSCDTKISVGNQWTLLTDVLETDGTAQTVRVEFYMHSVNEFLDIDTVMIS